MKNFLKRDWLLLILLLIPFLVVPFAWNQVPSQMAVHFGLKGHVNRYGSRFEGLLLIPLINVGLYALLTLLPGIDPKKKISAGQKPILGIRFFIVLFMLFIYALLLLFNMGVKVDMSRVVTLGVIFLFIVLGNYMNSIKANYFIGIRTPWTLEDPDVWRKTHRMASKLWVSLPIILIPILFLTSISVFNYFFLSVIALLVFIPVVYSYVAFQKKNGESHAQ